MTEQVERADLIRGCAHLEPVYTRQALLHSQHLAPDSHEGEQYPTPFFMPQHVPGWPWNAALQSPPGAQQRWHGVCARTPTTRSRRTDGPRIIAGFWTAGRTGCRRRLSRMSRAPEIG